MTDSQRLWRVFDLKVAILADQIDREVHGGEQSYAFNLIKGFRKKSVDYTLLYEKIPKLTNYPDSKKMSYRSLKLPFCNHYNRNRIINKKASNFDILHVLTNCGMPFGQSRAKKIVTIHDIIPFKHPEFYSNYTVSYYLKNIPEILKNVDAVITDSEFSKKDIYETFNFDLSKIYVVYLGIENSLFSNRNVPRPIQDRYILFLGGLNPRKGLHYFLKAVSVIKKRLPHKIVLIDHFGWRDSRIYTLINKYKLGNKTLLKKADTLDELVSFYKYADAFILPSLYEGFGLTPLEAMACGCPVITSNHTSLLELYEGSALLVNPEDTESLAGKILEVINDNRLRHKMIKEGLDLAIKLSQDRMIQSTLDVYKKVLAMS